jgi:hypothetical protein
MADADVREVGPSRLQGPDLLDGRGAGGGVGRDRRAGLPLRRGGRADDLVLGRGDAVKRGADLDHARPNVGAVHPLGQVPHEPTGELPLRRGLEVERSPPVILADVPGGGHHVDPRPLREAAQAGRVTAELRGAHLDDGSAARLQERQQLRGGAPLVVEHQIGVVAHPLPRRAGQQVLAGVGRHELLRGDVTKDGPHEPGH